MIDSLDCPGVEEVRSWREQVIEESGADSFEEFCAWTRREIERLSEKSKSLPSPPSGEPPKSFSGPRGDRSAECADPSESDSVREVREWRKRVSEDPSFDSERS